MLRGEPIPVTDMRMSRFWLSIGAAADFMLANYRDAPSDRALIPHIRGATVVRVIASISRILGVKNYELAQAQLRGVEKISEVLESTHERCLRSDTCEQYTDTELDGLLREVVLSIAQSVDLVRSA
jgi:FlaA1/EpsC-like NDP-sugar epimerase